LRQDSPDAEVRKDNPELGARCSKFINEKDLKELREEIEPESQGKNHEEEIEGHPILYFSIKLVA
jgi:hypothetical protein